LTNLAAVDHNPAIPMRKFRLKFISWVILAAMLTVTVNCVHESAHAMQSQPSATDDRKSTPDISVTHHCPCSQHEQHDDNDDCDTCYNCACHTPSTMQPFQFGYNPLILELSTFDPFRHIPEVYLPKFIPPQITA
jgi:hypothetical protein